jgi:hypothetical protein
MAALNGIEECIYLPLSELFAKYFGMECGDPHLTKRTRAAG